MLEQTHLCTARHDAESIVHYGRFAAKSLAFHTGICRCLASLCYASRHVFVCLRQSPREKVTMAQPQEVIARARALQGLVRAEAPRTESQRNFTAPVVQALLDAELFYLMVPAALGGLEVDGRTYLEVVEAIAAADGSTGWCVMIGAEVNGMVGVNLPADVARRLLAHNGPICCAGSLIHDGTATIEQTSDHY